MATTVTHTFTAGTKARAAQVNTNFTDIKTGINNLEVMTTRGDIIYHNATIPARLALGTAGKSINSNGTDISWAFSPVSVAKVADYTVIDTDGAALILVTTDSTNRTITLPTAADNTNRRITIIKVDSGTGFVIVDGEGAETINGVTTLNLKYQYQSVTLHCNGTAWFTSTIVRLPSSQVTSVTGNGHGSTDTKIRRITTSTTVGTAITVANTAANGNTYTINEAGVYSINYHDTRTASPGGFGISLNSAQLTTAINSITTADRLAYVQSPTALISMCGATVRCAAGDIIRPHDDGSSDGATSCLFIITQVSTF